MRSAQLGTVPRAARPPPALPRPPLRPVRPLPACPGTPQPARWRVAASAGWRARGRPGCYPAPDMAHWTREPLAPGLKEEEAAESAGPRGKRSGRSQRPCALRHAVTAAAPSSRLPRCWGPRALLRALLSSPPHRRAAGASAISAPLQPRPAAVTLACAGPTPYRLQRDPWWLGGPLQPSGFPSPADKARH